VKYLDCGVFIITNSYRCKVGTFSKRNIRPIAFSGSVDKGVKACSILSLFGSKSLYIDIRSNCTADKMTRIDKC